MGSQKLSFHRRLSTPVQPNQIICVPRLGLGLEVPKLYGELAKEFAIPLEGKTLKKILSKGSLKSDAIHPNASGYTILAESVAQLLRNSGAL